MSETKVLNLSKDQKIDLTKGQATVLTALVIAMGWDMAKEGHDCDLDVFAVALRDGKCPDIESHVLFYGSPSSNNANNAKEKQILAGCLLHSGDNLTGAGDGDDESIIAHLNKIPDTVNEVVVGINIHKAKERNQKFGMVKNTFCRAYNHETGEEIMRYDPSEDFSNFSGVILGRMYRKDAEWKFQALGEGVNGDLNEIVSRYVA